MRLLSVLERGARALRAVGLAPLVDRIGPRLGAAAARRKVTVRGFRLAGNHAAQLFYLREVATEGRERFFLDLVERMTPVGGTAVDAGAHIGLVTLVLARAAGPSGRVWAFEPNPEVLPVLRANLRRNRLDAEVVVVTRALAASAGRGRFFVSGGGETSSLVDLPSSHRAVEVELERLDAVLPDPPDVVKLDIEGGEPAALEGMGDLLTRDPDRPVVFAECNPSLLYAAGRSPGELHDALRGAGLTVWAIDEDARRPVLFAGELEGDYVNLVAARGRPAAELEAISRGE